jgi:ParB family chromosome partitioning protein
VLQPLRVLKKGDTYEVQDGHRRFLASRMAGLTEVPCLLVNDNSRESELNKICANLYREDVSAMDVARSIKHLIDEYNYAVTDIAKMMGRDTSRIYQLLALLRMPEHLQQAVEDKRISERTAHILSRLKNEEKQKYYLGYAMDGGATINVVQGWVAKELAEEQARETVGPETESTVETEEIDTHKQLCACCRHYVDANRLVGILVCPDCYVFTRDAYQRVREMEEEEKNGQE